MAVVDFEAGQRGHAGYSEAKKNAAATAVEAKRATVSLPVAGDSRQPNDEFTQRETKHVILQLS